MNTRSSNWTGRTHRSIESAFGPYARGPIHEPDQPMPTADKIVVVASALEFASAELQADFAKTCSKKAA